MKQCVLLAVLFAFTSALVAAPAWDPARTWVFAVGILNFQGGALHGWPEEGRVDAIMIDALIERGVPEDQIVFLKNDEATDAQIRKKFAAFLRLPEPGDTLIFYYAGHGGRDYYDPARPVWLVPYDTDKSWQTADVLGAIEKNFRGDQVLLTADCCHSGGLAEEAARREGRIRYGTLTSARSSATSTGNWTFTQCLADAYAGKSAVDLNHDGSITFAELAQYADLKMAFHENQRMTSATTDGFSEDLVLASTGGAEPELVGETCEGRWEGEWYSAQIIAAQDGKYFVTWPGAEDRDDAWLEPKDLRPVGNTGLDDGTKVEAEWNETWYGATIVRTELGLSLVHYDDFEETDDEWVPAPRIRPPS